MNALAASEVLFQKSREARVPRCEKDIKAGCSRDKRGLP